MCADQEMEELKRTQVNFCIPDDDVQRLHTNTFGKLVRGVRAPRQPSAQPAHSLSHDLQDICGMQLSYKGCDSCQ